MRSEAVTMRVENCIAEIGFVVGLLERVDRGIVINEDEGKRMRLLGGVFDW